MKKKNIKKYSYFVLVLIGVLLFAACGSSEEKESKKQEDTSSPDLRSQLSELYKKIYDGLEAKGYILYESGLGPVDGDFRGASGSIKVCENNYPKGFPEALKKDTTTTIFASYTGHEIKDILVNTNAPIYGYKGTSSLESNTFELIHRKVSDMYNSQPVVTAAADAIHGITLGVIYSGSKADGSVDTAANCSDWTSASNTVLARRGSATDRTDRTLVFGNQSNCSTVVPIVCVMYSTK